MLERYAELRDWEADSAHVVGHDLHRSSVIDRPLNWRFSLYMKSAGLRPYNIEGDRTDDESYFRSDE